MQNTLWDFFRDNLDYMSFFTATAFLFVALVSWRAHRQQVLGLPWLDLVFFGVLAGAGRWLDVLRLCLDWPLDWIMAVVRVAAMVFLAEFGRVGLIRLGVLSFPIWMYLPFLLATGTGAWFWGAAGLDGFARYFLILPAGFLASWAISCAAEKKGRYSGSLKVSAFWMAGLSVVIVFNAAFGTYDIFHNLGEGMFADLGRLLVAVFSCGLALALHRFLDLYLLSNLPFYVPRYMARIVAGFVFLILFGATVTQGLGEIARNALLHHARSEAEQVASTLDLLWRQIDSAAAKASRYEVFKRALRTGAHEDAAAAMTALERMRDSIGQSVCYLLDRDGVCVASSMFDEGDSFLGLKLGFRPYFKEAMRGKGTFQLAIGIHTNRPGLYSAYPVNGKKEEKPAGVLVIKREIMDFEKLLFNEEHIYLTDSWGVILAAEKKEMVGRDIYSLFRCADWKPGRGEGKQAVLRAVAVSEPLFAAGHRTLLVRCEVFPGIYLFQLSGVDRIGHYRLGGMLLTFLLMLMAAGAQLRIERYAEFSSKLKASERRYRAIFEEGHDAVFITDLETHRIVDVNRRAEALTGLDREKLIGLDHSQIHPEGEICRCVETVEQCLDRQSLTEMNIVRSDGTLVPVEISGTLIELDAGRRVCQHICRDVSDRMRAEEELRQKSEELQLVISQMPGVLSVVDGNLRVRRLIGGALARLGIVPEETIGKEVAEVLPGERGAALPGCFGRALAGESVRFEMDVRGFLFETFLEPLRDTDGKITGVLGVSFDITEKESALQALKRSEERFRSLFEQASDAMFLVDEAGRVEDLNGTALTLLGLTRDDVVGRGMLEFLAPGKSRRFAILVARIKRWQTRLGRIMVQSAQGRTVPLEVSVRRLSDGRILGSARDITVRTQWEQSLQDAMQAALDTSRAKDEFLANMSHEIRTPLNAIIGFAELLESTPLAGPQGEYVETIRSSGQMLLAMLSDLLDLSKIESGKLKLEEMDFELEPVLESVLRLTTPRVKKGKVGLYYALEDGIPRFWRGDPTRVRQIVLNLLSNAAKFTHKGQVVLTVGAEVSWGEEGLWDLKISVRDTGIGIPEKVRENIFDPFVQADASMTRRYGGSGLGLAIVRRLTRMMNGQVELFSQEGKGSEFVVRLRLKSLDTAGARREKRFAGKKMWVVAADEHLRRYTARHARRLGFEVEEMENADQAAVRGAGPEILVAEAWPEGKKPPAGARMILLSEQIPKNKPAVDGKKTWVSLPLICSDLVLAAARLLEGDQDGKTD